MHLRAVRLRGFKSFADPVELRLEPGVAVVVGPNGSGKSNVADAILWAAGSLAPTDLRAERPDDVLFAGAPGRPAARFCEVELLFDNADGVAPIDFAELSVMRRLHRGGEGQYLVNGATVRRTDVVELLAEVGIAGRMGSVIGQGRVEEVLASRPEERRTLVEDAAGLGAFKRRRHRAELKLARVASQVERARDLEAEVRARLRPLALQASAAERAQRVADELEGLRARLAALELETVEARRAEHEERRTAAALARRRVDERLEALLEERARVEDELADAAGRREGATSSLYRLRNAAERLSLRREAAAALADALRAAATEAADDGWADAAQARAQLERAATEAATAAREGAAEREGLAEAARLARERLAALGRSLAEREGVPPAARTLAAAGERLALALLDVEPGYERAVAAALGARASALLADGPEDALVLLDRARAGGLGSLTVLVPRGDAPTGGGLADHVRPRPGGDRVAGLLADVAFVEPDALTTTTRGVAVTRDGYAFDADRGELSFAGEAAEAVLLELESRRRALDDDVRRLAARAEAAAVAAGRAEARARQTAAALAGAAPVAATRALDARTVAALLRASDRLDDHLAAAAAVCSRLDAPLRARVDAGSVRAGDLAAALRRLGADEAELRRGASDAAERLAALDVERARLDAEAADARRRLEDATAPPADGDDADVLQARLDRLERRRDELGRVNPFAREDYERERGRLEELVAQREDLERSLAELERLGAELAETVDARFEATFQDVSRHFAAVAAALFPGGEGRLRRTPPGEPGEPGGIEVELRPAGKRTTRLSLLSGGEKALGAIAFLFALFLARPSPFYVLDEVEAALDDANIGRFVELLRLYADRAQFVVVTHQKRTMEAADTLYGVTMAGDGVSQVLSRRVPREAALVASA